MTWDTCVKSYLKIVENGCPEEFRPTWCEHCESESNFHRHGSYTRSLYTLAEAFEIRIFRFKCTACATACSILPSFLKRNHTAALDVHECVMRMNTDGVALRIIAEQLASVQAFSEKTLWRWKQMWNHILKRLEPVFWQTVLLRTPHLSLPRGKDAPVSTWGWFFWVWEAVHLYWSDKPGECSFQWLVYLSQSVAVTV